MTRRISVEPLTGALGATLSGLNRQTATRAETIATVRKALSTHRVIFARTVGFSVEELARFSAQFGELERHPYTPKADDATPEVCILDHRSSRADVWHTDSTYRDTPPAIGFLSMRSGGQPGLDTMWSNTTLALQTLSNRSHSSSVN